MAALYEVFFGFADGFVVLFAGVQSCRADAAVDGHFPLHGEARRQRVDRQVDAETADLEGGGAAFGEGDDGFGVQQQCGEDGAVGNALVDALNRDFVEGVLKRQVCLRLFGGSADLCHGAHGFKRVGACGGFGAEHDGVGAVQYGVGDVGDFSAGRHRVGDHAFHHLCGGDGEAAQLARGADDAFL